MIDAFSVAASQPWLITPEGLETILAIADRRGDLEALQARSGRPLDNTNTVSMRDGVAVIPVTGPIFRYANLFTDVSGATSTQVLATDIQTALDNPYVKAIVLDINSPGGEATGINELAQLIFAARGTKPINAYVGGTGASAAYWIASAADSITVDQTALLGSIGVVMGYQDTAPRDEKNGVRKVEIVSSNAPDKRADPFTESGRAKSQQIVDALETVFVNSVARNRGVSVETVLNDFGRGGVLVGAASVAAGMADSLGSLESVIARTAAQAKLTHQRGMSMSIQKGTISVSTTDDLRTALAAGYSAEQITIAPINTKAIEESAFASGREEGIKAGKSEGSVEATKAERERIAKIHTIASAGFEKEISEAINSGASAADTALAIMTLAKDRGVNLNAMASDQTRVNHANHSATSVQSEITTGWAKAAKKYGAK